VLCLQSPSRQAANAHSYIHACDALLGPKSAAVVELKRTQTTNDRAMAGCFLQTTSPGAVCRALCRLLMLIMARCPTAHCFVAIRVSP
jgi:hypothetical protein